MGGQERQEACNVVLPKLNIQQVKKRKLKKAIVLLVIVQRRYHVI